MPTWAARAAVPACRLRSEEGNDMTGSSLAPIVIPIVAMITLSVAQILRDLASYLRLPGAEAHYRHALAIGERTRVKLWRDAAMRRLQ